MPTRAPRFGTFSIVAHDRGHGTWGVAVQSKFIAVGSVVPWATAGVGALATQAAANVAYGPDGLRLLSEGRPAVDVVRRLTEGDARREERQLGVVDAKGGAASFTGTECLDWAGHVVGDGFACQGNILFGETVVSAMAKAYETTPGDLPERLFAALAAGQREGGDRRGMQSAAMLIVREEGGYDRGSDRWVDIRVDDHPSPIEELQRVFRLYDVTLLSREDPGSLVPIQGEVARVVQHHLGILGFYGGRANGVWDPPSQAAFTKFLNESNFESKARTDGTAWPSVLNHLQERAEAEVARRTRTAPTETGALSRGPGAQGRGSPSKSAAPKGKRGSG
jgi:uncharacterized Ntn-hydrolase superfamily protein